MTGQQADIKMINKTVSFPFDRMTVARFRETFPAARWNDDLQAWTVSGKTARKRIERWLASEADRRFAFSEERGRDAFQFEPILSQYLQVVPAGFQIRTPYSREVVDQLRQIPFARWNGPEKVWEVPFGSYDDLQHRWKIIEESAKRAEPEERRKRADARKGTEEEAIAKRRTRERRKHRLPFSSDDLPPRDRPVATKKYGIVVITEITGEFVEPLSISEHHPKANAEHIWAGCRLARLEELIHTWPAQSNPCDYERRRGWWQPTLQELREARQGAKSRERRAKVKKDLHDGRKS